MKVSKDNSFAHLNYDGTCSVTMRNSDAASNARVIEVPKVWREGGKQYKVEHFEGPWTDKENQIIRAPRGCSVFTICYQVIEYYD